MSSIFTGDTASLLCTIIVDGAGLTGAEVRVRIRRASDGLYFNFDTHTFEALAAIPGTDEYDTLAPVDAVRQPGVYALDWDTSDITNPVAPDTYEPIYSQVQVGLAFVGDLGPGEEIATGYFERQDTAILAAIAAAHGAGSYLTASGFAIPGDAMTLTAGALTSVQSKILDDATPFHGASIATILAFGAPPNAAANATAVWAKVDVDGFTYGADLSLLHRRQIYGHKLTAGGVLQWLTALGAVEATQTITDVSGNPITPPAAGEPARASAEV